MRLPSPSTIIASAALFVSLGGTGYAVAKLPANSVSSAQIRNGSIKAADLAQPIRPAKSSRAFRAAVADVVTDPSSGLQITVKSEKGDKGDKGDQGPASAVPGPQGDQGPTGAQGPTRGFAHITADGQLISGESRGVFVTTVPGTGIYCVSGIGEEFQKQGISANLDLNINDLQSNGANTAFVRRSVTDLCKARTDYEVVTARVSGSSSTGAIEFMPHGFYVTVA